MLLHRILTAIALAVPVVWIILFPPIQILMYLLLVIALVSGYEWASLAGARSKFVRVLFAIVIAAISWLFVEYFYQYTMWYVMLSVVWWFGIHIYLRKAIPAHKGLIFSPGKLAVALLVIPAAVIAMYKVHDVSQGGEWLLYGLMLVWVADIGAYFSGKKFGKIKLAPNISPGKTKEGLWGAILATSVYSLVAGLYFELDLQRIVFLLLLSLVLTVISVTGDLYESFLKREIGLKDSGNILPGHGGILDRIDGVLAAMPVFLIGFVQFVSPAMGVTQ
jgi:phosphatidate cytidylyltransferase